MLQCFSVQVVLLRLVGLNQPVLGIQLELWPDGPPQLQLPCTPPQTSDPWVYAVFQCERPSHGPFINHEATLNSS